MQARPSRNIAVAALIALVGVLAYSNTFTAPFQFDDDAYIVNNPIVRTFDYFVAPWKVATLVRESPTSLPPALKFAFGTRIMGYLSFALDYRMHGLHVAGYHVVNLMIHIMAGILVYLILTAILKTKRFGEPAGGTPPWPIGMIPLASSLLFASHPVQTQAVTYISQRFASLAALFYLVSVLLYIRARLAPPGSNRRAKLAGALLFAVAAMLTKEFSFTLPFVIALCEATFFSGTPRERIRLLAPFAATLVIIPALVFLQQAKVGALDSTMRTITAADTSNISRVDYLLAQFRVIVLYLRLLIVPVGQNVDHDVPVPHSLFEAPVFMSFLFLVTLFSAGVLLNAATRNRRESPELRLASFGILWFFITLSVESSIIPLGELVAEYRMYLPSVGMIVAVVSLASSACRKFLANRKYSSMAISGLLAAAVLVLSVATYQRNAVWGSEVALWEDAARKSPMKVRPRQNLGTYYFMRGRLDDAERELSAALALDPGNHEIHNNLGLVYKKMGRFDRAAQEFGAVLRLNPGDAMVHYNLGNLFLARGTISEAIREYRMALERIPDYDEVHNNLGIAYTRNGQAEEAIREFQEAVRLNPDNGNARRNLSNLLEGRGGSRPSHGVTEAAPIAGARPDRPAQGGGLP